MSKIEGKQTQSYYIVHYEQNGSDRAKYGARLLQNLSERLNKQGYSYRDLRLYRQFYLEFGQLSQPIRDYLRTSLSNWQSPIASLIGILLCTEAGQEMVEYATMGIDENLLISKYMLKLPSKEELKAWLHEELRTLTIEEDKR